LQAGDFEKCSPEQTESLLALEKQAALKIVEIKSDLLVRASQISDRSKKSQKLILGWVKNANEVLDCVATKLGTTTYICGDEKGLVCSRAYAGLSPAGLPFFLARKVEFCGDHFWELNNTERLSTLVHELSHKCGTTDNLSFRRFGEGNPPYNGSLSDWPQIADSYGYFVREGVCLPYVDCKY